MRFMDSAGNEIKEGGQVSFPLAFGQAVPGKVVKLDSGIGVGPASIPHVAVAVLFHLDVQQNGVVPGIFSLPAPATQVIA